jgi:nicotinamide-nucleotide amidase
MDAAQPDEAMSSTDFELARLAARIGAHLKRRRQTVTTAESCTGGWIAKALTDVAGSSDWFHEGFVTYSNAAKMRRLAVARDLLDTEGAVSEPVVRAMAVGALSRARADLAVAVSGIAGPGGAVPGKPVGTVWFGWSIRTAKGIRVVTLRRRFRGDRESVRRKTVAHALAGLLRL